MGFIRLINKKKKPPKMIPEKRKSVIFTITTNYGKLICCGYISVSDTDTVSTKFSSMEGIYELRKK